MHDGDGDIDYHFDVDNDEDTAICRNSDPTNIYGAYYGLCSSQFT